MKTSKLPLHAILMTLLAAPFATLGGCDLPDVEMPDDDEGGGTDGDASGGGGGSAKGLTSAGAADDGAADESGGGDPADGSDADADSGDAPTSEGCVAYCEVELTCDDFYDDASACVQDCALSAEEAGACDSALDEMYACVGTLDCEGFTAYWDAIDLLLEDVDPGTFPCDAELVAVAECSAA